MADREAEAYLRLLAEIMGVEETDPHSTRSAIEKALGVDKPGADELADAMGVTSLGAHPNGRGSSAEELAARYERGELKDSYPLPPIESAPTLTWFTEEDRAGYSTVDGFHPSGHSYEFTKLWYQLMGEEIDLRDAGDWHVAHGGLRWEYYGGATCADLHLTIQEAAAEAHRRYALVAELVAAGSEEEAGDWIDEDWGSLLEES